jgi:hypothetical protein
MPGPAFLAELSGLNGKEKRRAVLEAKHAAYGAHLPSWKLLLDAYDGTGGFLDGEYLMRYPREEESAYIDRQRAARYHNYAATLVDLYARKLFGQTIDRDCRDAGLKAWWDDVDGRGLSINTYMRDTAALSLTLGHVGTLVDKTPDEPTGPAVADERGRVVLARYLPSAMWDWRTKGDELLLVKLEEAVEPSTLIVPEGDDSTLLIWAEDGWARLTLDGDVLEQSADGFSLGLVPLVVCRPQRSHRWPFLGKPIFNAGILKALFNRASEEDEVLRNQAFSMLTVEVPPEADVATVRTELGSEVGTTRALIAHGKAEYISPDQNVPAAIRDNQTYLVQEIYRMAHMRFARQTLEAESAESIRLQFDELNEALNGIAAECQRVEEDIARLYFRWMTATPEAAEQAYEAAQVSISYPQEFFLGDLEADLTAWAEAVRMGLGKTATAALKKRAVSRVLPDLDPETLDKVQAEIDALRDESQAGPGALAAGLREQAMTRLRPFMGQQAQPGQPAGEVQ